MSGRIVVRLSYYDEHISFKWFMKCVETAKGPNSLTASGNDLDEAIIECRHSAREIAEK